MASPRATTNYPPVFPAVGRGRYEFHSQVGSGGMAHVFEVTDRADGRRVALKQLLSLPEPHKQRRNLELFEREFHTLAQLAHPRIVRVFDFGVEPDCAYYTMELLEGGDLRERAPLHWRQVCAYARDVCSALSLLHSRQFLHRDISPRNVRCLKDGPAKLIDFGALTPVGPTKLLVGTPPCCAPESLHLQSLDGRTDLFALGATLYFTLVGQHAFAARSFGELNDVWQAGFVTPSALVTDIPAELAALICDLLRLDPDERPASAAEVLERVAAIDGSPASEELQAAHAYLATPVLVGRAEALARVKRRLIGSSQRRARSVIVSAEPGMGRTRFLDAALLDATLLGVVVARSDSDDSASGEFGALFALARQLIAHMPEAAREAAQSGCSGLLGDLPELASSDPLGAGPANDVRVSRSELQRSLFAWFTQLAKHKPFVLAVDDFHRIDDSSAAALALLAAESSEQSVPMLITVEADVPWSCEPAHKLLQGLSTVRLEALSREESEQLLRSVFGDVRHIEVLSLTFYKQCSGRPRDLLLWAQHLIDRGVIRYAAGAWTLPETIDVQELPASLTDAMATRIAGLALNARILACALSLSPEQIFSYEACGHLMGGVEAAERIAGVEALMTARLVKQVGDGVSLSGRSWVPQLRAMLAPDDERLLHCRHAEWFERLPEQGARAAQHWLRAGQTRRALDVLVAHAQATIKTTPSDPEAFVRLLKSLPEDWFELYREAAGLCDELRRPAEHKFSLLQRLNSFMALLNIHDEAILSQIFATLRRDSGYDAYCALAADLDPQLRLKTALEQAQARYTALSADERVFDVVTAIRTLARTVVVAMAPVAQAFDVPLLRRLPLLTPFVPLSPALDAAAKTVQAVDATYSAKIPLARRLLREVIEMLDRPDRCGLEPSYANYLQAAVMNGLAVLDARLGLSSCIALADHLATCTGYEVNATVIRMLHALLQGDLHAAESLKRYADRQRLQSGFRQVNEGSHLLTELQAYVMSADLTRVRRTSEELATMAKRFPLWVPALRYATAEYYRLVHNHERAMSELLAVLASVEPGMHPVWPFAAQAHVLTLIERGDFGAALSYAQSYEQTAEQILEYIPDGLVRAAALSRAHNGDHSAEAALDQALARMSALGVTGINLGATHECRALVALIFEDHVSFATHAGLCRASYLAHKNSALAARYARIEQEGRRARGELATVSAPDLEPVNLHTRTGIDLALAGCRSDEQRSRLALTLLVRGSGALAGILFQLREGGVDASARVGIDEEPPGLLEHANSYLHSELESDDITATGAELDQLVETSWRDADNRVWRPILLSHYKAGQLVVTGIAAFVTPANRPLSVPGPLIGAISQFFAEHGATTLMATAD